MILAFDDFELDPDRLELRRAGRPVKADRAVLRLLAYLARNAGQLVTKPDLLAQVWDGRAVAENVITVSMARLRKTLGHGQDGRELIVNVHGRGYRFVRPVSVRDEKLAPAYEDPVADSSAPPFVGRERVLESLRGALRRASEGQGSVCVLSGEPGIGKTRVFEVLEHEATAFAKVAWGYCREVGDTPPLWPFVRLAREIIARAPSPDRARELHDAAAELARVVPDLLGPEPPGTAPQRDARPVARTPAKHRVFDAFVKLFALASEDAPLVLVLEDLHRADTASLELVGYFVDEISRARVLLLASLRGGERPPGESACAALDYVLGHRNCARVSLARLEPHEVATYVRALVGSAEPELARAVFDKSEGNPFFMVELVRKARDAGPFDAAALEVPRAAQEILRQRAAKLDADARGVLSCAAVIGRSFELPVLQKVSGCAPSALMASLDEALSGEVLSAAPDSKTAFAFGHELLRAAFYEALSPEARRACHLRVALALEQRLETGDAVPPADLAYHFHAALPHPELQRAVRHAIAAARAAERAYASPDAVRYIHYALEALDLSDPPNPRLRLDLLLWQALHTRAYAPRRFERLIAEVIAGSREQGAGDRMARAALLLDPNPGFPPLSGSRAALEEALRLLPPEDASLRAAVLARLATSAPLAFDAQASAEQLARARELGGSAPSPLSTYAVAISELLRFGGPDSRARADRARREVETLCRDRRPVLNLPPVLLDLHQAIVARQDGDIAAMHAALARGMARCQKFDRKELLFHLERYAAIVRIDAGSTAEGMAALERLYLREPLALPHGALLFRAYDRCVVLSDPASLPTHELGAALAPEPDDPPNIWSMKLRALSAAGRSGEALAALEAVPSDRLAALPADRDYLGTLAAVARAALALSARAYHEPLYALLAPHAERFAVHVSFVCEGPVSELLGALSLALGDRTRARRHFQAAVEQAERAELPICAQRARKELSRCSR